ncbi:anhydro-N-acetylmuramic acid kinase [Chelativorans salis]|uniref:Anhydro-N-acetylmuramic acid kinase n=1 Tax=Chelativorans salis TaxID=2978478 RepID=A0ABT2LSY4_9HYPH|nr:anhydro-N-acetylmuramic acid kinase [Chelativorans sp. EGI FJ00035]MCT7377650.1 anhydro-N-acetylmuramic acid kinase [Chelativorans sp. EGI FJ00035]
MQPVWAIGLMTGTVLDGNIDIAAIKTDGERIEAFGPWALAPYPAGMRELLAETLQAARAWGFEGPEPAIFHEAEIALSEAQAHAVKAFLEEHGFTPADIAAVGFHGQTVLHIAPEGGRRGHTRQLGDGARMAAIVGTDVVYDFRSVDVAAGGHGAPLAPIYHKAMLEKIGAGGDTAILNLGGVANITWASEEQLIAFDTGPANAPLNDWIARHDAGTMDRDGEIAAAGTADEERLHVLLQHSYLAAPFPKSLDRFDFDAAMADGLTLADGAATLAAFTAGAVGKALDLLPRRPKRLVVCGGGRKNPVIMREIGKRAAVEVLPAENVGLRGDAVEAECFAYLAIRSLRGLPLSFPQTTGVSTPQTGGILASVAAAISRTGSA